MILNQEETGTVKAGGREEGVGRQALTILYVKDKQHESNLSKFEYIGNH